MQKVIIFDGVCGLCNKIVFLLIKWDKKALFRYTSLQGEYVKTLAVPKDIDSIVLYENGVLYYKSTAILRIVKSLGGAWVFFSLFYLIPRAVRDAMYDIIAKHRYKIFGKGRFCHHLTIKESEFFID